MFHIKGFLENLDFKEYEKIHEDTLATYTKDNYFISLNALLYYIEDNDMFYFKTEGDQISLIQYNFESKSTDAIANGSIQSEPNNSIQ